MSRPAANGLNSYRKRSHLSMDGNPTGLPFAHYHRGHHYAAGGGSNGMGFSSHGQFYDPGRAFYADSSAGYDQHESWFEDFHVPLTPGLRLNLPQRTFERPTRYNQGLMTPGLMEQILDDLRREQEPAGPVPLEFAIDPSAWHPTVDHASDLLNSDGDLSDHLQMDGMPHMDSSPEDPMDAMNVEFYPDPYESEPADSAMVPTHPEAMFASDPTGDMLDSMHVPMSQVAEQLPGAELPGAGAGFASGGGGLERIVNDLMSDAAEPMAMEGGYGLPEMTNAMFDQAMQQVLEQQAGPHLVPQDPQAAMQQLYDDELERMLNQYMVPNYMMPAPAPGPGMPGSPGMPGMSPLGPAPGM